MFRRLPGLVGRRRRIAAPERGRLLAGRRSRGLDRRRPAGVLECPRAGGRHRPRGRSRHRARRHLHRRRVLARGGRMRDEGGLGRRERASAGPNGVWRRRLDGAGARREIHTATLPGNRPDRNRGPSAGSRLQGETACRRRRHWRSSILANHVELLRKGGRGGRRSEAGRHGAQRHLIGGPQAGAREERGTDGLRRRQDGKRSAEDWLPCNLLDDVRVHHTAALRRLGGREGAPIHNRHERAIGVRNVDGRDRRAGLVPPPRDEKIARAERKPAHESATAADRDRGGPARTASHEGHERRSIGDVPHVGRHRHPVPPRGSRDPAPVMVRSPAPWLVRDPGPAPRVLPDPASEAIRRPIDAHVGGRPDVSILRHVLPLPVGVEITGSEDILAGIVV